MLETISRWNPALLAPPVCWSLAAFSVALAIWLRFLLDDDLPPGFPYLTIFPVVILAAFFLGTPSGIAVAVACGLAAWYQFIPPFRSFAVDGDTLVARLMRHLHDPEGQTVDMARFLTDAGRDMLESGGADGRVALKVAAEPLLVGPEVSVPLGLIATELVANTLEHGFPDEAGGEISVSLAIAAPGRARLRILDNGRGLPEGFDISRTRSLGLSIARQFARQLGGTLEIERRPEGGTEARLEFSY